MTETVALSDTTSRHRPQHPRRQHHEHRPCGHRHALSDSASDLNTAYSSSGINLMVGPSCYRHRRCFRPQHPRRASGMGGMTVTTYTGSSGPQQHGSAASAISAMRPVTPLRHLTRALPFSNTLDGNLGVDMGTVTTLRRRRGPPTPVPTSAASAISAMRPSPSPTPPSQLRPQQPRQHHEHRRHEHRHPLSGEVPLT